LSVVAQLRLTAGWQSGSLHYTVGSGCCGSGPGTGTGLAGAPSADSESPLASKQYTGATTIRTLGIPIVCWADRGRGANRHAITRTTSSSRSRHRRISLARRVFSYLPPSRSAYTTNNALSTIDCETRRTARDGDAVSRRKLVVESSDLQRGLPDSVLFFSRPRADGRRHRGRTFSIYLCLLSF